MKNTVLIVLLVTYNEAFLKSGVHLINNLLCYQKVNLIILTYNLLFMSSIAGLEADSTHYSYLARSRHHPPPHLAYEYAPGTIAAKGKRRGGGHHGQNSITAFDLFMWIKRKRSVA